MANIYLSTYYISYFCSRCFAQVFNQMRKDLVEYSPYYIWKNSSSKQLCKWLKATQLESRKSETWAQILLQNHSSFNSDTQLPEHWHQNDSFLPTDITPAYIVALGLQNSLHSLLNLNSSVFTPTLWLSLPILWIIDTLKNPVFYRPVNNFSLKMYNFLIFRICMKIGIFFNLKSWNNLKNTEHTVCCVGSYCFS